MAEHVCPWWLGYWLINPFRKFMHDPGKILGPYVKEGMTVLEVGCGMGYFSLPLAKMAGERGRVVCVDLQDKMLSGLKKRAGKAGLSNIIEARKCSQDSLGVRDLEGKCDFVLLFAVAHEVPDKDRLFAEISAAMKAGGKLLFCEPKAHVSGKAFEDEIEAAKKSGLDVLEKEPFRAVLVKSR